MMYSILIVACLQAAPTDCRTYDQPVSGLSPIPTIAYVQAQALVAEWLAKHPAFKLRSFTLESGRSA